MTYCIEYPILELFSIPKLTKLQPFNVGTKMNFIEIINQKQIYQLALSFVWNVIQLMDAVNMIRIPVNV